MVNLSGKEKKITQIKIILSLLFTLILFSLFEIISKKIELNSVTLTGLRFFFGGLFILLLFFKTVLKEFFSLNIKNRLKIFFSGFLNVCIAMLALQFAVKIGNATTSAIIISSNPVFVFLIQAIGEKIKGKALNHSSDNKNKFIFIKFLLLLVGIFGIFLVVYKKDKGDNTLSIILAVLASLSFALYTIFSKKLLKTISSITLNSISFSINGFILLISSIFFYQSNIYSFLTNLTIDKILFLSILSFGVTGLAYITYFFALKNLDAVKVSLVFYLKPVVVLIINSIILFENVGFYKILGIFIILIALIIYINFDNLKILMKTLKNYTNKGG